MVVVVVGDRRLGTFVGVVVRWLIVGVEVWLMSFE